MRITGKASALSPSPKHGTCHFIAGNELFTQNIGVAFGSFLRACCSSLAWTTLKTPIDEPSRAGFTIKGSPKFAALVLVRRT
jgi:hypothetical protein